MKGKGVVNPHMAFAFIKPNFASNEGYEGYEGSFSQNREALDCGRLNRFH